MQDKAFYQNQIDTRALELSREALTRVEAYERHADLRYKELKDDIHNHNSEVIAAVSRVHGRIDGIFKYGVSIGISVVVLLLTVIGYLLTSGLPWR